MSDCAKSYKFLQISGWAQINYQDRIFLSEHLCVASILTWSAASKLESTGGGDMSDVLFSAVIAENIWGARYRLTRQCGVFAIPSMPFFGRE